MILVAITLETPKHLKQFLPYLSVLNERYHPFLGQAITEIEPGKWVSSVKPFHAGIFPYLCMDAMIYTGQAHTRLYFANDILDFSMDQEVSESDISRLMQQNPSETNPKSQKACSHYQGFGRRIDMALNAIGRLVFDSLHSLTKVETDVLRELRRLQFDHYRDPCITRTYGLQKQVASKLGKSPVAVHKSLKSSKYELLADSANTMKSILA
ncbi:MAG: hypothetical protein JJU05_03495 [Verrucomicrobia bacterium]|nr:hypothetical protein [Verrucomicrobiota bacterium]MCH8526529.1 hypothetical protein [Kiritimatiellia bacterium]